MTIDRRLKGYALFHDMTTDELARLSGVSHTKELAKGEVIHRHGQAVSHVFMLLSGAVALQLYTPPSKVGFCIARVAEGELFGVAPLLGMERYTATAVTESPCEVMAIEAWPLLDLIRANPRLEVQVLGRVARVYYERYTEVLRTLQRVVEQIPLLH